MRLASTATTTRRRAALRAQPAQAPPWAGHRSRRSSSCSPALGWSSGHSRLVGCPTQRSSHRLLCHVCRSSPRRRPPRRRRRCPWASCWCRCRGISRMRASRRPRPLLGFPCFRRPSRQRRSSRTTRRPGARPRRSPRREVRARRLRMCWRRWKANLPLQRRGAASSASASPRCSGAPASGPAARAAAALPPAAAAAAAAEQWRMCPPPEGSMRSGRRRRHRRRNGSGVTRSARARSHA
mmetsp:Transcript_61136/g.158123  ORF Transcript_61136/g.158123 Transcript_61136/m.158123 type:complete len:239 (-) Transcript_61136:234-950(-)